MAVSDDNNTPWGNDSLDEEIQNTYIRSSNYYDLDEFYPIMKENNTEI